MLRRNETSHLYANIDYGELLQKKILQLGDEV